MALDIKKETLCFSELFCKSKCEQALNLEINLPDYCCDIKRILKCIVTSGVSGFEVSGETVTVTGSSTVRLVYTGEGDKIDCYEHIAPFTCSTQIKQISEFPVIRTVTGTEYINCRAASQRRISINGNISLMLYVYRENRCEIPSDVKGMSVECKKKRINCTELICQNEKIFDMSETLALDSDKADIGKIIRSDCYVRVDSTKAVADKLLIKGELCCCVVYTDAEKGSLTKLNHTMPVSQIVNLTGVTEKSDIFLTADVCQFMLSAKNDSSGRCRLLEFAARVSAFVRCSTDKEFSCIEDCYSTAYEVSADYRLTDVSTVIFRDKKEIGIDETFDLSENEISEILDMWSSDVRCSFSPKKEKLQGECSFVLCGIYKDKNGTVRYAEKNMTAHTEIPSGRIGDGIRCDCSGKITELEFSAAGGTKVRAAGRLSLDCYIVSGEKKQLLCEIEVDDKKKKEEEYPALCLYFGEKDESLWDIARKYNTTQELICKENSLEGNCLKKAKTVMIPCV